MKHTNNHVVAKGDYKIILRHANGWRSFDAARLHISVPPKPAFDPRARSILDWSISAFDQVTLCLHDTIQHYNLRAQGLDEAAAREKALENGDLWLKSNIFPSDVFVDVVRWDDLLAHPKYNEVHERVCEFYRSNEEFATAIDWDLENFAARCRKRGEAFGEERKALSRAFLLEEVAGYIPLYQETSAADILPGMRMKAMQLLLDGLGGFNLRRNLMITAKTFDLQRQEGSMALHADSHGSVHAA